VHVEQPPPSGFFSGSIENPPLPFSSPDKISRVPNCSVTFSFTKNVNPSILVVLSSSFCSSRTRLKTGPPQPMPAKCNLITSAVTSLSAKKVLNCLAALSLILTIDILSTSLYKYF